MDYSKIAGATFVRFSKKEYLVHAGERPNCFYVVISGRCYRRALESSGEYSIRSFYTKGDIVSAFISYFNVVPTSDIVADTTVCCWKIPRESFLQELNHSPTLSKCFLEQVMNEYLELHLQLRRIKDGETPNLLCSFLLAQARKKEDGRYLVDKTFTNVKLAAYLGVHKVTIARILSALQKEQVILRTKEGLLVLDYEKMQLYANGHEKISYK